MTGGIGGRCRGGEPRSSRQLPTGNHRTEVPFAAMRTVPGSTDTVVIVGAGLGGLSAALHLVGAGRNVTVVERQAVAGGLAGLIRDHGYHFDTGPTVLTMPALVQHALAAVQENLDDWLTLH